MSRSSVASGMKAVSSGECRISSLWKCSVHLSCSFFVFSSMFVLIRPSCAFAISTSHLFCCHVYSPLLFPYCRLFCLSRKLIHGFSLVTACKFLSLLLASLYNFSCLSRSGLFSSIAIRIFCWIQFLLVFLFLWPCFFMLLSVYNLAPFPRLSTLHWFLRFHRLCLARFRIRF